MEVVDNLVMVYIPGAMEAGVGSLLIAGVVAFPLNRWLIGRERGHAVLHEHHR